MAVKNNGLGSRNGIVCMNYVWDDLQTREGLVVSENVHVLML